MTSIITFSAFVGVNNVPSVMALVLSISSVNLFSTIQALDFLICWFRLIWSPFILFPDIMVTVLQRSYGNIRFSFPSDYIGCHVEIL